MLNLSVSTQGCTPGRTVPAQQGAMRPAACETCGAPGGEQGAWLEEHVVAPGRSKFLCPLCHPCLHLDVAGRKKLGRVVWLPELPQEQLNLMCLAMFVALQKRAQPAKDESTKAVVESSLRLYKAFERRAESVETFLGGSAVKSLMPRSSLSSPVHIASLLVRARREAKLGPRELARRVEGLRLLPYPRPFERYIDQVGRMAHKRFPVNSWRDLAAAATLAGQAPGSDAHFDAESLAG